VPRFAGNHGRIRSPSDGEECKQRQRQSQS
jgi:hypothetical protein